MVTFSLWSGRICCRSVRDCALPNMRLKLAALLAPLRAECPKEAIYLVCGARGPQLKRNPLGSNGCNTVHPNYGLATAEGSQLCSPAQNKY